MVTVISSNKIEKVVVLFPTIPSEPLWKASVKVFLGISVKEHTTIDVRYFLK
jgi:hypothetical protein